MISRPLKKNSNFLNLSKLSLKNMDLTVHELGCYLPQQRLLFRPRQKESALRHRSEIHYDVQDFFDEITSTDAKGVRLELCSGHGHWITAMAKQNPDILWVAVEMKLSRAVKILTKAGNLGLQNLWVACCQGQWLSQEIALYNQQKTKPLLFSQVDIHFPDPWPKERHSHHRLLQACFLKSLLSHMEEKAPLHLVTDDLPTCERLQGLAEELEECFSPETLLQTLSEQYGDSYFENLWRKLQRSIYSLTLNKAQK